MAPSRRIASVDIVRGVVMALMLIDHVREFFYLQRQVADPVDLQASGLPLFFTRAASHICAPAFVLLAGLAVALRQDRRGDDAATTAGHLVRRGLILLLLEVTIIRLAWSFEIWPTIIYLQVIWAIGLSMIALGGLIFLPRGLLLGVSLLIIFGHNLLTPLGPRGNTVGAFLWSILDHRARYQITDSFAIRVSYPVLPYIGVIGLGYALGWLYLGHRDGRVRRTWLWTAGAASIALFLVLRPLNLYGEPSRFVIGDSLLETLASLVNTTKYPPSLLFLLMTLGPTLILLAVAEHFKGQIADAVARFGTAPMVYYVLHLYLLQFTNRVVAWATGTTGLYSFDHVSSIWIMTCGFLIVVAPLTLVVAGGLKQVTRSRRH